MQKIRTATFEDLDAIAAVEAACKRTKELG